MKDFYRILQVERNASKPAIKQAYKNLARKYHPDLLSSDRQGEPGQLEKIQELNEAYSILSDDKKRAAYDLALKADEEKIARAASPFEHRSLLVRCSRTKHTYKMLLIRRKHTKDKFEITGFESMDKPLLAGHNNWLAKVTSTLLRKPRELAPKSKTSDGSFETRFYTDDPIGIHDIAWRADTRCPDCDGRPALPAEITSGWFVCGVCKQLFYADRFKLILGENKINWCPWCGARNKTTAESYGNKWRIRGQEASDSHGKDQNLLPDEKPKALGDGKPK